MAEAAEGTVRWRLVSGAEVDSDGEVRAVRRGAIAFRIPSSAGLQRVLAELHGEGLEQDEVASELSAADEGGAADALGFLLRLKAGGLIEETLEIEGVSHARRVLASRHGRQAPFDPGARYTLSRFAFCRRRDREVILESPRCGWRVALLTAEATGWLHRLSTGSGEEPPGAATRFLAEAGMLSLVGSDGRTGEDVDEKLRTWEFHDLLFHARSRRGLHDGPVGATKRFVGEIAPLSLRRGETETRPRFELPAFADGAAGPGLFTILESRRSRRPVGAEVGVEGLAELLYRAVRAQRVDEEQGLVWRPAPTGGAIGEPGVYAVVARCRGLEPGMYRYDGIDHVLVRLAAESRDCGRLLSAAAAAQGRDGMPAVLLILASRFACTAWKYEGLAYSLLLKNAGCLLQTIYLVAAALEIPVCAVGTGNSVDFARATGLPAHREGPVAEITLG